MTLAEELGNILEDFMNGKYDADYSDDLQQQQHPTLEEDREMFAKVIMNFINANYIKKEDVLAENMETVKIKIDEYCTLKDIEKKYERLVEATKETVRGLRENRMDITANLVEKDIETQEDQPCEHKNAFDHGGFLSCYCGAIIDKPCEQLIVNDISPDRRPSIHKEPCEQQSLSTSFVDCIDCGKPFIPKTIFTTHCDACKYKPKQPKQRGSGDAPPASGDASLTPPSICEHEWTESGEFCEKCGDKRMTLGGSYYQEDKPKLPSISKFILKGEIEWEEK